MGLIAAIFSRASGYCNLQGRNEIDVEDSVAEVLGVEDERR